MPFRAERAYRDAVNNIALAQHADDQVETIRSLCRAVLRLPGLAAMPARWQRQG